MLILIAIPEDKVKEEEKFCLWIIKEKLDHYFRSVDLDYKYSKEVHKFSLNKFADKYSIKVNEIEN